MTVMSFGSEDVKRCFTESPLPVEMTSVLSSQVCLRLLGFGKHRANCHHIWSWMCPGGLWLSFPEASEVVLFSAAWGVGDS